MKAEADRADQAGAADTGRNSVAATTRAEVDMATRSRTKAEVSTTSLMEAVVDRSNLVLAYQRVLENKGAAGVDQLAVSALKEHLKRHWLVIRARLLAGRYQPAAVRRVDIPKPQGGVRTLGIPTVVDRLIQQALHQVAASDLRADFLRRKLRLSTGQECASSVMSSAPVRGARQALGSGHRSGAVLRRVNHDLLMSQLAKKIDDARVLTLNRRYLEAGMMADGLVQPRTEGTPQGGPLSPLLSNILLTELDRELERRGHTFCRYADDCNVYVASARAGERLRQSLIRFLSERLKLKVNASKSAVARPWQRTFLGYSMTWHQKPKLRIAAASVTRLTEKVKALLRGARGRNVATTIQTLNPLLRGWAAYFKLAATKRVLEESDGWIRHKLRCVLWRQWKRPYARARNLMKRGLTEERAWRSATNGRGPWWNSGASHMHAAFPKSWFDHLRLVSLLVTVQRLQRIS